MFFSTLPSVAEGFQQKTWRGGPQAGTPKLRPVAVRRPPGIGESGCLESFKGFPGSETV